MEKIINFAGELNAELGDYVVGELLDIYDKNKAIIETNERLKYQLDYLPLYADTVEFRINSNGGDLYKFLEIYDLMERMKEEQRVVFRARVSSHAFSAGMYLFCACDYRTMSKFGSLMYHEMSMMRMDKLSDLESETRRMNKIQKILDDIVTRDTGLTQEMLDSYKGRDFWIDFDKAVEYGILKEEPTEQEQLAKALEDMEKEDMTESEWNAFIDEMKSYVNIIPDKPSEQEIQEKIKEMEQDDVIPVPTVKEMEELLGKDFKCGEDEDTLCDKHGNTCCFMCNDLEECKEPCTCILDEDLCKHIEDRLDELDNECDCEIPCEDCTCKEKKASMTLAETIKGSVGSNFECDGESCSRFDQRCCYFCEYLKDCEEEEVCGYALDNEMCECIKEGIDD